MQIRKAQRTSTKIRAGLSGPSGSGKTLSALLLASGITYWEKIYVIDTEAGSADLYSHLGPYNVLPLEAPHSPERYIQALATCIEAGAEVIIIDSCTHEWSGIGGCLEIHDMEARRMKTPNSFQAWGLVTPRHQAFINAILKAPCHIICTLRSKTDYIMVEKNGRQVPEKVGLAAQTREGFEYELTLSFALGADNRATASKDRTGMFMGQPDFLINQEVGKKIKLWCEDALPINIKVEATPDKEEKASPEQISRIKALLDESFVSPMERSKMLKALPSFTSDRAAQAINKLQESRMKHANS